MPWEPADAQKHTRVYQMDAAAVRYACQQAMYTSQLSFAHAYAATGVYGNEAFCDKFLDLHKLSCLPVLLLQQLLTCFGLVLQERMYSRIQDSGTLSSGQGLFWKSLVATKPSFLIRCLHTD